MLDVNERISIASRIFAGFIVLIVAFGGVSIYGIANMLTLSGETERIFETYLPLSQIISRMENALDVEEREIGRLTESASPRLLRAMLSYYRRHPVHDPLAPLLSEGKKLIESYDLEKVPAPEQEPIRKTKSALISIEEKWKEYLEKKGEVIAAIEERVEAQDVLERLKAKVSESEESEGANGQGRAEDKSEIARLEERISTLSARIAEKARDSQKSRLNGERRVKKVQIYVKQGLDISGASIKRREAELIWGLILLTAFSLIVAALVTFFTNRALAPIKTLIYGVRKLIAGDMNFRVSPLMTGAPRELAQLAKEFDEMGKTLLERQQTVELATEKAEKSARELKRLNTDLLTFKRFNENIILSIRLGVIAADSDLAITLMNRAASELWETQMEDARGKPLSLVLKGHPLFASGNRLAKIMAGENPFLIEAVRFEGKSGTKILDVSIVPLRTHEGEADGLLIIADDVTEKLDMRRKLIQQERLAVMGRLTAQIAHEIRNPLNSIGLNIELIEEFIAEPAAGENKEQLDRVIGNIKREIKRLSAVAEEYLRFARLPAPDIRREELNRIISNLLAFLEPEFNERGISVKSLLSSEEIIVSVDAHQLRQALLNVLRNAIEAVDGGGKIEVTSSFTENGAQVVVTDYGAGIPPEDVGRIFDPFFSTKKSGTGLGLAVTRQIITDHGGTITCKSELNKGSEFIITLPKADGG